MDNNTVGATNYCKDKRDQSMKNLVEGGIFGGIFTNFSISSTIDWTAPIQPKEGPPFYWGGQCSTDKPFFTSADTNECR